MKNRDSIIQQLFDHAVDYRVKAIDYGMTNRKQDEFMNLLYFDALLTELKEIDPKTNWQVKIFDVVWEICGKGVKR